MRTASLLLSSTFLSGILALAQLPNAPTQPPPLSTPPTFPQGQSEPHPGTMPPDTRAPAPHDTQAGPHAGLRTVEGCLGGTAGNYILTDDSGASLQLHGDAPQLSRHVGQQVRITGTALAQSGEAAEQNGKTDTSNTLLVDTVDTLAKTCASRRPQ